uniref:Uncharacterized protein n=1 Tax=Echeneis naucrates TaxID=173247 RepID=A0A665UNA2_ECHNA
MAYPPPRSAGGLTPNKTVIISNIPPFIKNEDLSKALSRLGRMVPLGYKSQKLQHVDCHRRQLHMVLKDTESPLNLTLTLTFKVEGFSYMIFITTDIIQGFGCGAEGHLILACPQTYGQFRVTNGPKQDVLEAQGPSERTAVAPCCLNLFTL